jgi:hypothetical protein
MAFQAKALAGYNKGSTAQLSFNLAIAPLVAQTLLPLASLASETLHISDYGCSEGYNSMVLFSKVFESFRKHSPKPIFITHTDLPANNWNSVFATINESQDTYLKHKNIYYSTIGRSFYSPLCAPNSVHFGFSASAFHYLSKKPENFRNDRVSYPEANKQMTEDLAVNLGYRVEELTVGGKFFLVMSGRMNDEETMSERVLFSPIKTLVKRGIIREEEYKNYCWPTARLSKEEVGKAIARFDGKIEVEKFEMIENSLEAYKKLLKESDQEDYRSKLVDSMKNIVRNPLFDILSERSEAEKEKIFESVLEEAKNMVKPEEMRYCFTLLIFRKIRD